ncbi:MAG: CpsD/CapB family tyrosine-protein kinase [Planctomycetota bacterium]|nr:CpsD/CapB family tyrosine-protein kinase [Planctomycetota bacterium]
MAQTKLAAAELSPHAEDIFRGLWTSLFHTSQSPPKSVLVCSSNPGEGATTITCGLALAGSKNSGGGVSETSDMVRSAGRVVLVDFNLRTPAVSNTLNVADGLGISDVMVGRKDLGEALQHIGPGQLDILTAGSECRHVLEILRADRVRGVMEELQRRYDYVIVDSSPVNQYPDAQVLAEIIDSVVLVAHAFKTPREALLQARKRLHVGEGKVAGVVLNMRTYPVPKFVYRRV